MTNLPKRQPQGRSVPEWIADHPDQKVPTRVRVRIFERYDGRDYTTGQKIAPGDKWELEHVIALCNGGEHREGNMAPILAGPNHKAKTAADLAIKKKGARIRAKNLGIHKPKSRLSHPKLKRRMDGTVVSRETGEKV